MTEWYEKYNNMTIEEKVEAKQKILRDVSNMNEEQRTKFAELLRDIAGSMLVQDIWRDMQSRKDEDYELNEPQYAKFLMVSAYFTKLVRENSGEVEQHPLEPKMCNGYISIKVKDLRLEGEKKTEFFNAIRMFSSFGIDAMTDGTLCIEGVVPEVFVRKDVVNLQSE
ncbi:MAG: hypothetical protein LUH03_06980 [Oscillospiraceae bacterium]|nr:hypothetical protein [Oscillospiraceae bacterium]